MTLFGLGLALRSRASGTSASIQAFAKQRVGRTNLQPFPTFIARAITMEAKVGEGSPKVVFIIGSTGTGKSKLGIDICKKYGGEVINADAIQMYKGLDIATAKVTEVEMDGVPHHLLSFLEPLDESYTVREFRTDALALIDDITKRNRLPVVVGGTMYYVQALLRGALLDEEEEELGEPKSEGIPEALKEEAKANPGILYESLLKIDPIMAKKLHPNDLRRVERSLEVYYQFGVPQSTLLQRQSERLKDQQTDFDTVVLYIDCPLSTLTPRLDARVDKMVAAGLMQEIRDLRQLLRGQQGPSSTTPVVQAGVSEIEHSTGVGSKRSAGEVKEGEEEDDAGSQRRRIADSDADQEASPVKSKRILQGPPGLLQAIGYKEFEQYLALEDMDADEEELKQAWQHCVDNLKLVSGLLHCIALCGASWWKPTGYTAICSPTAFLHS